MSRTEIVNKSDPPKSEWFGYKYKVNPETSKLLQEAVFKDGGGWSNLSKTDIRLTDSIYLFVSMDGNLSHQGRDHNYFNRHPLIEKQPPQPSVENIPYQFKVGDKVRIKDCQELAAMSPYHQGFSLDSTHTVEGLFDNGNVEIRVGRGTQTWSSTRFKLAVDKEDEVVHNGIVAERENLQALESLLEHKHQGNSVQFTGQVKEVKVDIVINKQEETKIMSNVSKVSRRVVNVVLIDEDAGLPVDKALVHDFGQVVAEDNDSVLIQQLIMDNDVRAFVDLHNEERSKIINIEIEQRTGNSVKLRPILLKDLKWIIS